MRTQKKRTPFPLRSPFSIYVNHGFYPFPDFLNSRTFLALISFISFDTRNPQLWATLSCFLLSQRSLFRRSSHFSNFRLLSSPCPSFPFEYLVPDFLNSHTFFAFISFISFLLPGFSQPLQVSTYSLTSARNPFFYYIVSVSIQFSAVPACI